MLKKIEFLKIRMISRLYLLKINYETKKYGISYLLLILISCLFAKIASMLIKNEMLINHFDYYQNTFTDTGIALIGFSGIVFTLQIFNQEIKNNYTNSIMQKILDIKFQHIIQYIYLILLTILFILIPRTNFFLSHLNYFIPFYYFTLIVIFMMFGIDLFISTSKSNKLMIIKEIEKRINGVMDFVEKQYLLMDDYSKKQKQYNPPIYDYISKANSIFIGYIQCINYILRQSIDDVVLFQNGMEVYVDICKNRFVKRKNEFNYSFIPFLSDVLPKKDNDTFIEKFILEYLDEYANIAVKTKNRDILSIIQSTYYNILMVGKNNRYINTNGLELTVKIVFIYYLKVVKYIVDFGNDNLLFETIEIFKEIFIKNKDDFYELIDIMFFDEIEEMSKLSLDNNSLMNYMNIQGLIIIPIYSILNSKDESKKYRLELIFNTLKKNLILFLKGKDLVKRKDEGRTYLNYIFNILEPYSSYNFLKNFFNNNIDEKGNYINNTIFDGKILKPFIDFYCDDLVINCLIILEKDNVYVTGFTDAKSIILLISSILIKLIDSKEFEHIKQENVSLLTKSLLSIEKYSKRYERDSMRTHEVHDFYLQLFKNCKNEIINNKTACILFFNNYLNCLITITNKEKKSFKNYYKFINLIFNNNINEKYIEELIERFIDLDNNIIKNLYNINEDLSKMEVFNESELSYENKEKLKHIIENKLKLEFQKMSNEEINTFVADNKIKISKSLSKNKKIESLIK